jgi:hypothetical protein
MLPTIDKTPDSFGSAASSDTAHFRRGSTAITVHMPGGGVARKIERAGIGAASARVLPGSQRKALKYGAIVPARQARWPQAARAGDAGTHLTPP